MVQAPEKRNKLAPKATLCMVLGYMENMKAYKLYDVERHFVTHGVHATFLEDEYFVEPALSATIEYDDDYEDEEDIHVFRHVRQERTSGIVPSCLRTATLPPSRAMDNVRNMFTPASETHIPTTPATSRERTTTYGVENKSRWSRIPVLTCHFKTPRQTITTSRAHSPATTQTHFRRPIKLSMSSKDAIQRELDTFDPNASLMHAQMTLIPLTYAPLCLHMFQKVRLYPHVNGTFLNVTE
ncbi:unnamed protein product [Aphanomyces euteiches]